MNIKNIASSALVLAGSALLSIKTAFGADVDFSLSSSAFPSGSQRSVGNMVSFFIKILFAVGGVLMLVYLILGGIRYITSGGDKIQAQAARDMITNALIGIIIVASSYAIATLLNTLFGIDVFNASVSLSK